MDKVPEFVSPDNPEVECLDAMTSLGTPDISDGVHANMSEFVQP